MKKGIVPLWISLFFSFLAVVLLIVFYFFFLRGSKEPANIATQESYSALANNMLISYLNTPVAVQGEAVTFADLIRLWHNDKQKYEPLLQSATSSLLSKSAFASVDAEGKTEKFEFWLEISRTPTAQNPYRKSLLAINLPRGLKVGAKEASTIIAVSSSETITVTMYCAGVE